MPDLRKYLEENCPLDKNQRTGGLGGLVRYSNGFIGPFSDKDYSEPGNYRPGPTAEEIEEANRFLKRFVSKEDTER